MKKSLVLLGCAAGLLTAQEQKVKPADVPAAVRAALSAKYASARVAGWTKEKEDGKTTYEASVLDEAGRRDVVFHEDGSLEAVEQAMPVADLPAAVKRTVQEKYAPASIRKAERITKGSETQYEVDLSKGAKKEVLLSAAGQVLKEE